MWNFIFLVLYNGSGIADSSLPDEGLKQFRKKLGGYKKPRTLKRRFSLFVSPGGEHVAVAVGNQIIILQKDDDYMEPCGIFVSKYIINYKQRNLSCNHEVVCLAH